MCILIESNLGAGAGELLHRSLRYYKRGSTGDLDCISLLPVSFSTHGDHVNIILLWKCFIYGAGATNAFHGNWGYFNGGNLSSTQLQKKF